MPYKWYLIWEPTSPIPWTCCVPSPMLGIVIRKGANRKKHPKPCSQRAQYLCGKRKYSTYNSQRTIWDREYLGARGMGQSKQSKKCCPEKEQLKEQWRYEYVKEKGVGEGLLSKGHNKSKDVEKKTTQNLGFSGGWWEGQPGRNGRWGGRTDYLGQNQSMPIHRKEVIKT